jgi:hypothetical protein
MLPYFLELDLPELVRESQEAYNNDLEKIKEQHTYFFENLERLGSIYAPLIPIHFPNLRKILVKYPFLNNEILLFGCSPGFCGAIHIDVRPTEHAPSGKIVKEFLEAPRLISINIPLSGCNTNGVTEFFNTTLDDFKFETKYHNALILDSTADPSKICEYSLTSNPILTNTQISHRVNNTNNKEFRISLSWSIRKNWTWNMLCNKLNINLKETSWQDLPQN